MKAENKLKKRKNLGMLDNLQRMEGKAVHFKNSEDFPGGPVARTLCSQCRGPRFDPWSGN